MSRYAALLAASLFAVPVLSAQDAVPPVRVFDSARKAFVDIDATAAAVAAADVAFVGEVHDDAHTHAIELALVQSLAGRRGDVVLSLEMFERDVQEPLDHFLMGHMSEDEFLQQSRPWPRYRTDYKPLVDLAVARGWPVIAANTPRPIATKVAHDGLDALASSSDADKKLFASDHACPAKGSYYKRFVKEMGGHSGSTDRYYQAQCLKDETMAESIAQAYTVAAMGGKRPLVVHVTGAFHSDYREGTVERTLRRMPGKRVLVLSVVPIEKMPERAPGSSERKRADFLLFTPQAPR